VLIRERTQIRAELLQRSGDSSRPVLLHVDEAHRLNRQLLHSLKEMQEWRSRGSHQRLMGVLFSGWPELVSRMRVYGADVWQRVGMQLLEMQLLSAREVTEFVEQQMAAAGARRKVFTPEALDILARRQEDRAPLSVGFRCQRMLAEALHQGKSRVDADVARAVMEGAKQSRKERMQEAGLNIVQLREELEAEGVMISRPGLTDIVNGKYPVKTGKLEKIHAVIDRVLDRRSCREKEEERAAG